MNLLNEIQETTLMMNLYQQQMQQQGGGGNMGGGGGSVSSVDVVFRFVYSLFFANRFGPIVYSLYDRTWE
jgi:hypothetical protein